MEQHDEESNEDRTSPSFLWDNAAAWGVVFEALAARHRVVKPTSSHAEALIAKATAPVTLTTHKDLVRSSRSPEPELTLDRIKEAVLHCRLPIPTTACVSTPGQDTKKD